MSISKKINRIRRILMRGLTKNIGASGNYANNIITGNTRIKRVLICRPNDRLGNLLLLTPLVQEVALTFPGCRIDLFVRGSLAPIIFKNYENIHQIIQLPRKPFKELIKYIKGWIAVKKHRYDIVVNVVNYSSSGRLSAQLASSRFKIFGDDHNDDLSKYCDYKHVAKCSVYNLRNLLSRLGHTITKDKPAPSLNLKLSPVEKAAGKKLLQQLVRDDKGTICLFTYATGEKCYCETWWLQFYDALKTHYPDYNIIEVLPKENISQIAFKAPTFYSKDIREIGALIAATNLFIGADSGIMHLASAVQTPTVGLFSVTNPNTFQPYSNNSVAIDTNTTGIDESITIIRKILYPATTA